MRTLHEATLDAFLPLARMQELVGSSHAAYLSARPFPHLVLDDFFDPTSSCIRASGKNASSVAS